VADRCTCLWNLYATKNDVYNIMYTDSDAMQVFIVCTLFTTFFTTNILQHFNISFYNI
jgi:hypothetical protein